MPIESRIDRARDFIDERKDFIEGKLHETKFDEANCTSRLQGSRTMNSRILPIAPGHDISWPYLPGNGRNIEAEQQ